MVKYSYELKRQVIQDYLDGLRGYKKLAQKYGLPTKSIILQWLNVYECYGFEGLEIKRKKQTYSREFNLNAIEYYLSKDISYREAANQLDIDSPSLLTAWVLKYNKHGTNAFINNGKRQTIKTMPKTKPSKIESQRIRELEIQLRRAQVEIGLFKRTSETTRNKTNQEKVEIIRSLREHYTLTELLETVGLAKSSYFYGLNMRKNKDIDLENKLKQLHQEPPNAGYRPLAALLRRDGMVINEKRVLRVMRKLNLLVTNFYHKSRKYNSYRGYVGRVAKHLIRRRFETTLAHQKITIDTTEFKYYEKGSIKKAYLDPFIDLFNREVLSYSIAKQPSAQSIMNALNQAIDITSDCLFRHTFHSDQGWAYQMHQYTDKLKEHRIFQSMSRKGNCHDNSVMENFFGLLKQEIYYGYTFSSYEELKQTINQWIYYYNTKRVKKKLGWLSPIEYRLKMIQ
ncbi:IS3 family transposase [Lactococcus garvieae]|uniref:IS3 family transposase n=1 Tax=Lactococcus garvieae TaxID=1363 RepID=UPI00398EF3FA